MEFDKMIMPAVIAGVAVGVVNGILQIINAIPILGCLATPASLCMCCLLPIAGGALAAHLYSEKTSLQMESGAVVGGLAGVIGGILSAIIGAIVQFAVSMLGIGASAMQGAGSGEMMSQMGISAASGILGVIIGGLFSVVLGAVFGAVGGVIYVAVQGKKGKPNLKSKAPGGKTGQKKTE